MKGKRITFTGAHGTGKTTLQMKSMDLLIGVEKTDLGRGTTRQILSSIHEEYMEEFKPTNELELACAFARRIKCLQTNPELYVVSDRWALDELSYTMVKMDHQTKAINSSNQILGIDGNPVFTQAHGELLMTQAAFQVLLNQVAIEKDYWDFIYHTPIYDGVEIEEDGIRPKEKLYQKEVDSALQTLIQQLQLDVVTVPVKFEDSFEFLESESRKWLA